MFDSQTTMKSDQISFDVECSELFRLLNIYVYHAIMKRTPVDGNGVEVVITMILDIPFN